MPRATLLIVLSFFFVNLSGQNALNKRGERTGAWKGYYPDSTLRYEGNFQDGVPVGTMKRYDNRGNLAMLMRFYPGTNGSRCLVESLSLHGKVQARGVYQDQVKDSTWTYLSPNGEVRMTEEFYLGRLNGMQRSYYPSGELSQTLDFKDGKEHGKWIQYFTNGDTMLVAIYRKGMLNGPYRTFYPAHKKRISGMYKSGHMDGSWLYFTEEQELKSEIKYQMGVAISTDELEQQYEQFIKMLEESEGKIPDPAESSW